MTRVAITTAAAVVFGLACAPATAQVFSITGIFTFGGNASFAHAINDSGAVVGYATNEAGENRAFSYSGGMLTNLGTLGGSDSQAFAINNNGQVVGFSRTATALEHAFLYNAGTMSDLGTLGGSTSFGFGINDVGQIVGGSTKQLDTQYRAFRRTGTTMTDLGTLGGFLGSSESLGIDSDGTVVGWTSMLDFTQHAFIYRNNVMTDLGTLGGGYSYAHAIKNGVVVGGAFEEGNAVFRAFRWEDGTMSSLGAVPERQFSVAYALNANGLVVGKADNGSIETERAFLHVAGSMIDLNDLIAPGSGWTLQQARGVNDSGQIVGFGTFNGQSRGFVLDLVGKMWTNPAGGVFATAGNWFTTGEPAPTQSAVFPLDATYTVNISSTAASASADVTRGNVTFDLAGANYTINQNITVASGATLRVQGTGMLSGGGELRVGSGATFSVGAGQVDVASLSSSGIVEVTGGVLQLRSGGGTSLTSELRLGGATSAWTGRIDLTDNSLIIDYSGDSPLAFVRDQISSARGTGDWSGDGITSSLADASSHGLGYAEASSLFTQFPATFAGRQVDNTSVLLQLTRYGDANLDGFVNLADFNLLAANFGQIDRFWNDGDFNYDGVVNLNDFNLLASNFGLSAGPDGPTPDDWSALASVIPEPVAAPIIGIVATLLGVRRPRSRASSIR